MKQCKGCNWPLRPNGQCINCDHLAELRQHLTQAADDFLERVSTPVVMSNLRDELLRQIDDAIDSYTSDVQVRTMKNRRKK